MSISGVMTNAVCNYCIYFAALIPQKDSLVWPMPGGKKISEMSHINNAPDGDISCAAFCSLINPF